VDKILLVAESENDLGQLTGLTANRYELVVADGTQSAGEWTARESPALILVDVALAEAEGFKAGEFACRSPAGAPPVIFITERSRPEDIAKAFACGGQDHVAKPFVATEFEARLELHLKLRQSQVSLEECVAALEQKNRQLRDITEQFENAARIDLLTAIPNRWYMQERMKDEAARSFRYQRPLTVIAVRIDGFVTIVGDHGRDCGDFVLQSVADILRTRKRGQDVVARWDEEVFLVMLPETSIADGGRVAERIRARIEASAIDYFGRELPVTVTAGVAEFDTESGIDAAVERATAQVAERQQTAGNSVVLSRK
jgi:two-component system, cell cycle response regulator